MAVGSSMLATIRTAPPQWAQVVMSMEKTRLGSSQKTENKAR
ncbi:TPA: hypothetical protein ACPWKG_005931 [Pseudomonas aeruginosa]